MDASFGILTKQLVRYDHVNRMTEERLPKKLLDFYSFDEAKGTPSERLPIWGYK